MQSNWRLRENFATSAETTPGNRAYLGARNNRPTRAVPVLDDRLVEVPADRPDIIAGHGRSVVHQEAIGRPGEFPCISIPMLGQGLLILFYGVSHCPNIIGGNGCDCRQPIEGSGNRPGDELPGRSIAMQVPDSLCDFVTIRLELFLAVSDKRSFAPLRSLEKPDAEVMCGALFTFQVCSR